jgi:hypothetical protein
LGKVGERNFLGFVFVNVLLNKSCVYNNVNNMETGTKYKEELKADLNKFMEVIKSMKDFHRVEFIILHGSSAEGRVMEGSDIDVCIYYLGSEEEQSRFRLKLLEKLPSKFDVQIFQQLPLYVKKEVLKGKDLYVRHREFMYDTALQSIREYDSFQPHLMEYIKD